VRGLTVARLLKGERNRHPGVRAAQGLPRAALCGQRRESTRQAEAAEVKTR